MKTYLGLSLNSAVAALVVASQFAAVLQAQDVGPEPTFELSPFAVDGSTDSGYRATNSISGTRLSIAIKDVPMPIEVVTREFMEDTGATDLRQALKYSSGIILESQNDLSSRGPSAYQGPGGVNNAEGATANTNGVQLKLRGFVTDNALRDGFLRQNSTDSVNIERVEVVRGPAALLYGTGNFGGVVNYMVLRPSPEKSSSVDVTYGTDNLMRGTFDSTGALSEDGKLAFRVSGVQQFSEDHTEHFDQEHFFVAPSILWRPSEKTEIYVDAEYGEQNLDGIGARRLRSVANVGFNNDQNEHSGFYTPPGANPRTYRVTGPDTFLNSQSSNFMAKVTHELFEGGNILAGYNYSTHDQQLRDMSAQLFTNVGPESLQQTINLLPIVDGRASANGNVQTGEVPGSIIQYQWNRNDTENTRHQYRVEFAYEKSLFENASEWLRVDNQILAGYSRIEHDRRSISWITVPNEFNFRSPNDLSPLRFSSQGDGSPTAALFMDNDSFSNSVNKGQYISYLGSFIDNRLKVMIGARNDKNDTTNDSNSRSLPGDEFVLSSTVGESQDDDTNQYGANFKLNDRLSFYALESEGLQPNFSGQLLADTGAPAGASFAKSEEIGIKFDLMDGRISGTISKYKIRRVGYVGAPWFSPVTLGSPNFDPNRDIVYNVSNWTPSQVEGGSNGGSDKLDSGAPYAAWLAGVESGAIFQSSEGNGSPTWYVNASMPDGAAYLDNGFAANAVNPGEWAGFLYQGETGDSLVNNATQDTMAFHGNGSNNATLLQTDESKGFDAQILFNVSENFQLVTNAAITEVERISYGQWMAYPYRQDRWAVWNYDNASWGTFNFPREEIYGDPGDGTLGPATETRTSAGQLSGDDTPKYRFDFWGSYKFTEGRLNGTTVGLGGYWESKREYLSGVTRGAGQNIFDTDGRPLVLFTDPRYNLDAMVRYDWRTNSDRRQYVQLNVSNLLNDRDLYGLIYARPLSAKIAYGRDF